MFLKFSSSAWTLFSLQDFILGNIVYDCDSKIKRVVSRISFANATTFSFLEDRGLMRIFEDIGFKFDYGIGWYRVDLCI